MSHKQFDTKTTCKALKVARGTLYALRAQASIQPTKVLIGGRVNDYYSDTDIRRMREVLKDRKRPKTIVPEK